MHMLRDLGSFGERVESAVLDGIGRTTSRVQKRMPLPVDLLESDEVYLAVFDAPGTMGSDIDVRFDDNTVSVHIDRFRDYYEDFELRLPGRGMTLNGSVTLPEDAAVDPERATARLTKSGTIQVEIPKVEPEPSDTPIHITMDEETTDTDSTDEPTDEATDEEPTDEE